MNPSIPLRSLGDLITIKGGGTPSRQNPAYWGGTIPWATVKDIQGSELSDVQESITEEGLRNSASQVIEAGHVITATRMALGRAAIATKDVAINQDLKALLAGPELHPRYLLHFIISKAADLERMGKGATVKGILIEDLKNLRILHPPLDEQRRIVAILDKADALRRKAQQALDLTDDLIRSTFLDMFGDPVSNPRGWEAATLGELLSIPPQIGTTKPATPEGVVPVVKVGDLGKSRLIVARCDHVDLEPNEIQRLRLEAGDILLARAIGSEAHLGKASLVSVQDVVAVFDSHVMRVRTNPSGCLPEYLYHFLQSAGGRRRFMMQARRTAVQFNINATQIRAVVVPMPPLELQRSFRDRLLRMEEVARAARYELESASSLFGSILGRAFTGGL